MKQMIACILSVLIVMGIVLPTAEAKENDNQVKLAEKASSAIIIERDTGEILFEKNSHEQLPPASMTKIMTLLLIMEAIDKGTLSYDDMVRTSEYAASMGGSQVFLEPGEEMSVSDMIKAIAIASGNDASVAMAEHIAGTEEEFAVMMNEKAEELGLTGTHFVNPNGLPASDHYTTAHDLAVMSKELLKYEDITNFTKIYDDYLRKGTDKQFWLVNTNKLVKFYPGVDGLKTGFTREAMYGLTATAEKNGMRVITVVMGAPTPKDRNAQVTAMLDYSFSQFMTHKLYDREHVLTEAKVTKGEKKEVSVMTDESVSLLTKKGEQVDDVIQRIEVEEEILAPVSKGEQLGTLYLEKDGEVLSETALVSTEDVDKASWWQLFKRMMTKFGAA